jgi:hypothetical protein
LLWTEWHILFYSTSFSSSTSHLCHKILPC